MSLNNTKPESVGGSTDSFKQKFISSLQLDESIIREQLKRWQEKLLDMSKSNPLLGINRSRSVKFKIEDIDPLTMWESIVEKEADLKLPFVKQKPKRKQLELEDGQIDEVEKRVEYEIEPGDINFEVCPPADLKRKLRRIYDNARSTIEERGVITLYITIGAISWNDDVLGDSISPLVLVPCEFVYKGPSSALRVKMADEDVRLNPALKYYFKEKHKIDFPELPEEINRLSLEKYFGSLDAIIKEQNWKVVSEVWIGTFSFESLVLYQDLKVLADLACANPVVAALARALSGNSEGSEALPEALDDLKTPEIIPIPLLPADSSQVQALAYSALANHLVIHGPPGTGKSQTISNIIADALGRNKKVLFVSAKMAALNVVFERLKKEGLGEFCLEAHGIKAGKLKIIEDLKRTLELEGIEKLAQIDQDLETLIKTKRLLNEYVISIHKIIEPIGCSIFGGIGKLTNINAADSKGLLPWNDVLQATLGELETMKEALNEVSERVDLFTRRHDHPWRGFSGNEYALQVQEQIESLIRAYLEQIQDFRASLKRVVGFLPEENLNYEDLIRLTPALEGISKVTKLPCDWWKIDLSLLESKQALFRNAERLARKYHDDKKNYASFTELVPVEFCEITEVLETTYGSFFGRINISYYNYHKLLKSKLNAKVNSNYKSLRVYRKSAQDILQIENWFTENKHSLLEEVSDYGLLNPSVLAEVSEQCATAILIRKTSPDFQWGPILAVDQETSNGAAALAASIELSKQSIADIGGEIEKYWPQGFAVAGHKLQQTGLPEVEKRSVEVLENIDQLRDWIVLKKLIQRCHDLNLLRFVETIPVSEFESLSHIFEKRFWTLWVDSGISKNPALADFTGLKQKELVEKFRMLDSRVRRIYRDHIKAISSASSRRVKDAHSGVGSGSEVGTLRVEMQKRKRIKPLRKLFSEIPHVLQTLKPCMLMSPISVSTYLKPESFHFDLVIFDEASQLPTAEAIPSILRANQVIVAGDPNQLPPTSFFNASLINDNDDCEDENSFVSLESLLDDCVAAVPVFRETCLRWHYRSRDERLISFSNHYFYDNKLITFPSAQFDNSGRGTRLEYVPDGVWDRGKSRTNRKEARRAAQLAIEHFEKFPDKSLGIVALNSTQKEAIEDCINDELVSRPELQPYFDTSRENGFFVKSLESVQGDERDVIMISIGYGKNTDGNLTLNFGPLNADGGWRRLNVLVTRAKWQIILVTSLRSSELHRINPLSRGPFALKNYIEYCERNGSLPPDLAKLESVETNDFEDSVRAVLVDNGYSVDAQVGVGSFRIDLAVRDPRDPSKYLIGIECDGATYHSSRVARDRDLIREEILMDMGWKLYRVWSTEWFHNRNAAASLMLNNIQKALDGDSSESMPAATIEESEVVFSKPLPKIKRRYKPGIPYKKFSRHFNKETLLQSSKQDRLNEILEEMIQFEGPIHVDILDDRLKDVFRIQKIGANIRRNIDQALKIGIRRDVLAKKKEFIWFNDSKIDSFRTPSEDVFRTIRLIPPQEIALGILYLAEDQFGLMKDQIPSAVAKLFQDSRLDPDEADIIRDVMDKMIDAGALIMNGNQINVK
jgi:very-short-patch-repair endonuclease